MFVIYNRWFLFLVTCYNWISNKVNSESSGISSEVSIFKATLSAYLESAMILRGSQKSNNASRVAYNPNFLT